MRIGLTTAVMADTSSATGFNCSSLLICADAIVVRSEVDGSQPAGSGKRIYPPFPSRPGSRIFPLRARRSGTASSRSYLAGARPAAQAAAAVSPSTVSIDRAVKPAMHAEAGIPLEFSV